MRKYKGFYDMKYDMYLSIGSKEKEIFFIILWYN